MLKHLDMDRKTVAVLCCAKQSVYKQFPEADCWHEQRDANGYRGNLPVVAHPPCRAWSVRYSNRVNPMVARRERRLGRFCVHAVQRCGGVLEQPAFSRLWKDQALPVPGEATKPGEPFSLEVWACWFGFPTRKRTWLYVVGCMKWQVSIPFGLWAGQDDGVTFERLSSRQRSATPQRMAEWLCNLAEKCAKGGAQCRK